MNRPEAEKLLGGHAAGILTDDEKRTLYAAALARQELFDALVDEEALREVLADPEARRRLLAALSPPDEVKVPSLWRRPAFIGLAASLFALVTTSLIVLRRPEAPVFQSMPAGPASSGVPGQVIESGPGKEETELPRAAARKSFPAPKTAASGIPAPAGGAGDEAPVPPEPEVQAVPAPPPAKSLDSSSARELAAPVPMEAPVPRMAAKRAMAQAEMAPLEARLERLTDQSVRLKVTWNQVGHLYVLARTSSGAKALAPAGFLPGGAGSRTVLFEFSLEGVDAVDVYVLREPVQEPGSLPGTGPVDGERRRVYPD